MSLDNGDIRQIASYARIALSDEQVESMTKYFNGMLKTLEPITHYNLDDVEPTFYPIGDLSNVMREDRVEPSLSQEEALHNAPAQESGQFYVPSILGGGE